MLIVFYDSWCPFCMKSAIKAHQLDILNKLTFVSFRDQDMVAAYQLDQITLEKMAERLFVLDTHRNKWHSGIFAILQLARRVPLYWILVPAIYFSIWLNVGQSAYDFIAKRRNIIPVGKCQSSSCEINQSDHPKKQ